MATLSIQLIIESLRSIVDSDDSKDVSLTYVNLGCLALAIVVKVILFFYCYALRKYPNAKVLAQDHGNDVLLNVFGIALSIAGDRFYDFIDPLGAILIAIIIFRSWTLTAVEQISKIVGKSADSLFLNKLVYITLVHDDRILEVDTWYLTILTSQFFF